MYKCYFIFLMIFSVNVLQAQAPTVKISNDIRLAQQGNTEAQYRLGFQYFIGQDVFQDHQEAFNWYRKAAEQGHTDAQYNLAWMYLKGIGVEQDKKQALALFKILAEKGDAEAQYQLGETYFLLHNKALAEGEISLEEYYAKIHQAFLWYERAAEQGHAEAQYKVAQLLQFHFDYEEFQDINYRLIDYWYRQAAEQGHTDSQCKLAWIYFDREGVDQNLQEALYWAEIAARNRGICSDMLVDLYLEESFKDIVLAYAWFTVLYSPFFEDPSIEEDQLIFSVLEEEQNELTALLSPSQILEAEKIAKNIAYEIDQNMQAEKDAIASLLSPNEIVKAPRLSSKFLQENKNTGV